MTRDLDLSAAVTTSAAKVAALPPYPEPEPVSPQTPRPRRRKPRRYRPEFDQHLAGVRALGDGVCARCDEPVLKEQRVVKAGRDKWMHIGCASGASDE